jgi:hypothetical protein
MELWVIPSNNLGGEGLPDKFLLFKGDSRVDQSFDQHTLWDRQVETALAEVFQLYCRESVTARAYRGALILPRVGVIFWFEHRHLGRWWWYKVKKA